MRFSLVLIFSFSSIIALADSCRALHSASEICLRTFQDAGAVLVDGVSRYGGEVRPRSEREFVEISEVSDRLMAFQDGIVATVGDQQQFVYIYQRKWIDGYQKKFPEAMKYQHKFFESRTGIWLLAARFPKWAERLGIFAGADRLLIPNAELLNEILSKEADPQFQLGHRFGSRGSQWYVVQHYPDIAFFENLLNKKIVYASRGERLLHDIFGDHFVAALVVGPRIFERWHQRSAFVNELMQTREIAAEKSARKLLRQYAEGFSKIWDRETIYVGRNLEDIGRGADVLSNPKIFDEIGFYYDQNSRSRFSSKSLGLVRQHLRDALENLKLPAETEHRLLEKYDQVAAKYDLSLPTLEDRDFELHRLRTILSN